MRRNPADPTSLGFLTTSSPETDRELTTFATQYRTFRAGSQSQTICEDNLARSYPRVHAVLKRELVSNLSLLYAWTGSDPLLDPMMLLAHRDVVPIEPGTEAAWEHPPFSGAIADGYVLGRGAPTAVVEQM